MSEAMLALDEFIEAWTDTAEENKKAFVRLKSYLEGKADSRLEFLPRPGVTYSLRAAHDNQKDRSLFVMVDVIEDQPRWLSVCFYGDMVTDPEERGDFVPEGLLGEDAVCLDIDAYDEINLTYIEARIDEAHAASSGG